MSIPFIKLTTRPVAPPSNGSPINRIYTSGGVVEWDENTDRIGLVEICSILGVPPKEDILSICKQIADSGSDRFKYTGTLKRLGGTPPEKEVHTTNAASGMFRTGDPSPTTVVATEEVAVPVPEEALVEEAESEPTADAEPTSNSISAASAPAESVVDPFDSPVEQEKTLPKKRGRAKKVSADDVSDV
jgi:hypothetical protein